MGPIAGSHTVPVTLVGRLLPTATPSRPLGLHASAQVAWHQQSTSGDSCAVGGQPNQQRMGCWLQGAMLDPALQRTPCLLTSNGSCQGRDPTTPMDNGQHPRHTPPPQHIGSSSEWACCAGIKVTHGTQGHTNHTHSLTASYLPEWQQEQDPLLSRMVPGSRSAHLVDLPRATAAPAGPEACGMQANPPSAPLFAASPCHVMSWERAATATNWTHST